LLGLWLIILFRNISNLNWNFLVNLGSFNSRIIFALWNIKNTRIRFFNLQTFFSTITSFFASFRIVTTWFTIFTVSSFRFYIILNFLYFNILVFDIIFINYIKFSNFNFINTILIDFLRCFSNMIFDLVNFIIIFFTKIWFIIVKYCFKIIIVVIAFMWLFSSKFRFICQRVCLLCNMHFTTCASTIITYFFKNYFSVAPLITFIGLFFIT